LVSRLRTCDTFAIPLAVDFGCAVHAALVMDVMEEVTNALQRGEMSNRDAQRVIREIDARTYIAKKKARFGWLRMRHIGAPANSPTLR